MKFQRTKLRAISADARSHFRSAESHLKKRQYTRAKTTLSRILDQQPDRETETEVFLWLAEICLDEGDTRGAEFHFNKLVSATEDSIHDPALHALHGRIRLCQYREAKLDERNDRLLAQAIESFQDASALNPDSELSVEIYLGLGRAFHDRGELSIAVSYLEKALSMQPRDRQRAAECHMELGLIELWARESPETAIPLLQLALKTSPLHPPSNWQSFGYWCLGWAFLMSCNPNTAVNMGHRALRTVDSMQYDHQEASFSAHYLLGAAYYDIPGREDLAIHHYHQALNLREDPEILRYLGDLYLHRGEAAQALRMFDSVLQIAPEYARPGDIYNGMGMCLAQMKQYEKAIKCFKLARDEQATVSFRPFEIYNNMGISHWHLGQYEEAADAFRTALGLMHPEDKDYHRIEWYLREAISRNPPPSM